MEFSEKFKQRENELKSETLCSLKKTALSMNVKDCNALSKKSLIRRIMINESEEFRQEYAVKEFLAYYAANPDFFTASDKSRMEKIVADVYGSIESLKNNLDALIKELSLHIKE